MKENFKTDQNHYLTIRVVPIPILVSKNASDIAKNAGIGMNCSEKVSN